MERRELVTTLARLCCNCGTSLVLQQRVGPEVAAGPIDLLSLIFWLWGDIALVSLAFANVICFGAA